MFTVETKRSPSKFFYWHKDFLQNIMNLGGSILGGFPRALVSKNKKHEDIDIFCEKKDTYISIRKYFQECKIPQSASRKLSNYLPGIKDGVVDTFSNSSDPWKFQVIYNGLNVEDTLETFDWTVCKVQYLNPSRVAYFSEECYNDEQEMKLRYSRAIEYFSLDRLEKYHKKGYQLPDKELIRIFIQIPKDQQQGFVWGLPNFIKEKKYPEFFTLIRTLEYKERLEQYF